VGKVYFVFGVHNHQPVGNFPHIFKEAYERCYLPFLNVLEKFPKIKCNIHNSGPLYDWIAENDKGYLDILKKLVKRGQVEIISGGYYEPILPLISDEDKYGQIRLMNRFIEKEYGRSPRGIWTAERVWEPYLAKAIHDCNLQYTFLDDTHFRYAGLQEKEFFGYYTSDDEGKPIFIFPISKTLRYKVPFSQAQEAIDVLNSFRRDSDILVTLFDDGEKFGLWPETFDWVYNKKWLEKFFSLLEDSASIQTITAAEAINKFSTSGIVYLPTASYEEMGEWVLEPQSYYLYEGLKNFLKSNNKFEEFKDFIRGGFFKNFYRKYPRLNYMHKRMLSLSKKLNSRMNLDKDEKILRSLWKAQTNCGYWHGVFGGFYLGHIRQAVYENLISAQNLFDRKYNKKTVTFEKEDVDLDGNEEVILKNDKLICCFSPKGGALLELSLREPPFNLINTITRREESYHKKIRDNVIKANGLSTIHETVKQKEKNLDKFLVYDKYERLGLIDHILEKNITVDDFNSQRGIYTLSNTVYDSSFREDKDAVALSYLYGNKDLNFLKKIIFSLKSGLEVIYKFNKKNILKNNYFGIEFNLSLPSLKDIFKQEESKRISLSEGSEWGESSSLVISDTFKGIAIEFSFDKADIFTSPVYSVSSSESGFEKVYQQIAILFILTNKKDSFKLSLKIERLKG
jgi:alpha-amylase